MCSLCEVEQLPSNRNLILLIMGCSLLKVTLLNLLVVVCLCDKVEKIGERREEGT